MVRKAELFPKFELSHKNVITWKAHQMFLQERDWTCAISCIRTLLSGMQSDVPSEDSYIKEYKLGPSPYYSKDIKRLELLAGRDVIYGCDVDKINFDKILSYLEGGYGIMLESLHNYAHWMVLLGYYPLTNEADDKSQLLMYDPYMNQVRLLNTEEFVNMWIDADHNKNGIVNDFIAIR